MSLLRTLRGSAALALVVALAATVAVGSEEPAVSLRWALGARDTDTATPAAIKQDTQLESGTRLKFLVEPLSPGAVYLILLDSGDELTVLHRESVSATAGSREPTYIPSGRHWFELDDRTGLETFFLLASTEPLSELDALLDKHESAADDARVALTPTIVAEIRRLHKEHRKFSRPVEKPVLIGGQTRGGPDGEATIDNLAVEITAERFYGKTITIDH